MVPFKLARGVCRNLDSQLIVCLSEMQGNGGLRAHKARRKILTLIPWVSGFRSVTRHRTAWACAAAARNYMYSVGNSLLSRIMDLWCGRPNPGAYVMVNCDSHPNALCTQV